MARTTHRRSLGALAALAVIGVGLASAAEATTPAPASPVVFGGDGLKVKLNHHPAGLSRTSPAFRGFVHRELEELWGWADKAPECRTAPVVSVLEYRRSGFAYLNEGIYAVQGHPECAGGGNWQFAVRRDGRWVSPRALGGQDVPSCRRLHQWDIPRMSGAEQCYDGTQVVDYRNPLRAS